MWKRRSHQQNTTPQNRFIGNPILIETSFDEKRLENIPTIADIRNNSGYSPMSPPDSGSRRIADVLKGLPPLPIDHSSQPNTEYTERPLSEIQTTSSMYSQPTPELRHNQKFPATRPYLANLEISPPSSPDTSPYASHHEWNGSPEISPVEELSETEEFPMRPKQSKRFSSSIPVLRRAKKGVAAAGFLGLSKQRDSVTESGERDSTVTKWDDFIGEPTTKPEGKPGQVKPKDYTHLPEFTLGSPRTRFGYQVSISGGNPNPTKKSFVERMQGLDAHNSASGSPVGENLATNNGRRAMSEPANGQSIEKPLPPTIPIAIPLRSPRRPNSLGGASGSNTPTSATRDGFDTSSFPVSIEEEDLGVKPVVPLKVGRNSPPRISSSPLRALRDESLHFSSEPQHYDSPMVDTYDSPAMIEASPVGYSFDYETPQPRKRYDMNRSELWDRVGQRSAKTIEENFRAAMREMDFQEQPVSRFSATTCDTTTNNDISQPATPSAPSTPVFAQYEPPSPIVNRRRPLTGASANSKATRRKPTPLDTASTISHSNSKSLPISPPEAESVDLITSLQAKLDNLQHQRRNLQRLIYDMTQLMPPDPIRYDALSKAELKQKENSFRMELAEVQRQEHDAGMRLHRAWRRRDQQFPTEEPTGFWVRRVTG
ncbi:MAG: hypothetical protein M1829_003251 [Trizodia sp. TS-e1964]|nr:MAG: hypothetical protein M1829_003251 [Trizodia sp. TS-e1964]